MLFSSKVAPRVVGHVRQPRAQRSGELAGLVVEQRAGRVVDPPREVVDAAVEALRHLVEAVLDDLRVDRHVRQAQHASTHLDAAHERELGVVARGDERDGLRIGDPKVLDDELVVTDEDCGGLGGENCHPPSCPPGRAVLLCGRRRGQAREVASDSPLLRHDDLAAGRVAGFFEHGAEVVEGLQEVLQQAEPVPLGCKLRRAKRELLGFLGQREVGVARRDRRP